MWQANISEILAKNEFIKELIINFAYIRNLDSNTMICIHVSPKTSHRLDVIFKYVRFK